MCDYSAEGAKRRDAVVGDQLVTARISQHTVGLVSKDDPTMAVCLKPGAQLIVSDIPQALQQQWGVGAVERAVFDQKVDGGFRDGVLFHKHPNELRLFHAMSFGISVSVEEVFADKPVSRKRKLFSALLPGR